MKVSPDYNELPYKNPNKKPRLDLPKHFIDHRMIEGIYQ